MPICLYYNYVPKLEKEDSQLNINTSNCCLLHKRYLYEDFRS